MKLKKIKKRYRYVLGQSYYVVKDATEGVMCIVGHLNQGIGFLFPAVDDPENPSIATHICYAKVDRYGKVTFI